MNTRPNGLYTAATPVTEPDPHSVTSQQQRDAQVRALAAQRAAERIEWSAPASDRLLAQYRQEIELGRQARNRGAHPSPLRVPGGVA